MRTPRDVADLRRTSRRLGLQTGLLVVACLVVVGTLLYVIYDRAENAATDRLLKDALAAVDRASEAPPGIGLVIVSPQGRSSYQMPTGFPDESALAAVARDGRTREREYDRPNGDFTVRTAKNGDRVTQAVVDRHELEDARARVVTALLIAGAVGVVLASLVGAWLARRAVTPMADTIAMQRRFVADASHELRTPLTLLSTRVQLLARKLRRRPAGASERWASELAADVDGVVADTRLLTDILDELLIAADTRATAQHETVDLAALLRESVAAAAAAAHAAGVSLVLEGAEVPVLVDGAPASLRRALTSLVDNAIDHARSEVVVALSSGSREVRASVSDDGPGISPEVAPRLFDRFTSVRDVPDPESADRRHYGLGLALVADVAAAHDGRVTAGNRGDGTSGAVLTLHLPTRRP